MSEIIENVEAKPEPRKRTVKEFLNQYRSLGLPGAKRFRRRTRLEEAKMHDMVSQAYIKALVRQMGRYRAAMEELKRESNWTVKGEDVAWVGESDPLEIIKKAEE